MIYDQAWQFSEKDIIKLLQKDSNAKEEEDGSDRCFPRPLPEGITQQHLLVIRDKLIDVMVERLISSWETEMRVRAKYRVYDAAEKEGIAGFVPQGAYLDEIHAEEAQWSKVYVEQRKKVKALTAKYPWLPVYTNLIFSMML